MVLCESPRVWLIPGFLPDEDCAHIINIARHRQERSQGFDVATGESKAVEIRTSSHTFLPRGFDPVIARLEQRIADIMHLPVENGEELQVLRYQIGQEYKAHHDYFDPRFPGSSKALDRGGQRIATMLIYLSSVEEGGETVFPARNLKVRPVQGNALLFTSLLPNGDIDPDSLHASEPVICGEKWVATKWLRQRQFT